MATGSNGRDYDIMAADVDDKVSGTDIMADVDYYKVSWTQYEVGQGESNELQGRLKSNKRATTWPRVRL